MNHLYTEDFLLTDCKGILGNAGIVEAGTLEKKTMYAFSVSSYGALYSRAHKGRVPKAKAVLLAHRALNPRPGRRSVRGGFLTEPI